MTENQHIKKGILLSLSNEFSPFDFKLKGDTLIRETETGLYQIIGIGLGRSTSIMSDHIGIDFGIATEEWLDNLINWKRPKVLTTADCEIRDGFCDLVKITNETIWYPISLGPTILLNRLSTYIKNSIIPFFDQLKSRQNIIQVWQQKERLSEIRIDRQLLFMGTLMFLNHDKKIGEEILKSLQDKKQGNSYFVDTITKVLTKENSNR
jgi:hypothetical protein